jgi:hypothetical protein
MLSVLIQLIFVYKFDYQKESAQAELSEEF